MNAFQKLAHLPQKYCIFYAKQLRLTKIPLITTLSRHQKAIQRLRNCCEIPEDKNLHRLNDANLEHVFPLWVLRVNKRPAVLTPGVPGSKPLGGSKIDSKIFILPRLFK